MPQQYSLPQSVKCLSASQNSLVKNAQKLMYRNINTIDWLAHNPDLKQTDTFHDFTGQTYMCIVENLQSTT